MGSDQARASFGPAMDSSDRKTSIQGLLLD